MTLTIFCGVLLLIFNNMQVCLTGLQRLFVFATLHVKNGRSARSMMRAVRRSEQFVYGANLFGRTVDVAVPVRFVLHLGRERNACNTGRNGTRIHSVTYGTGPHFVRSLWLWSLQSRSLW